MLYVDKSAAVASSLGLVVSAASQNADSLSKNYFMRLMRTCTSSRMIDFYVELNDDTLREQ